MPAGFYAVFGRYFFPVQHDRSVPFAIVHPWQRQPIDVRGCGDAPIVFEHLTRVDLPFVPVHLNGAQVAESLARRPVFCLRTRIGACENVVVSTGFPVT